ncbi:MOSC domain-containing protein [Oricola cellulosilytica]|uniref:MOSC domain-containing protein n=1 Tax=Oricola cellulosilytica TaxID=1429082 RepID=A0A4R0PHH4_9HYPH|nr:MOSC domain-containing protein [Oricola cellulosilytica]TCD16458.1 MOSC domain-containing protein [Oricola cellulosilytica]
MTYEKLTVAAVLTGPSAPIATKDGRTGIFKRPRQGPVSVSTTGLDGDTIVDTVNHGGPDQAVLVPGGKDSEWWAEELGPDTPPGTFGENLYVDGLESADIAIGDVLQCGPVRLQATAPRIPCVTLAVRMKDARFPKRFFAAGRPGFYCRVLCEGEVEAGMDVQISPFDGTRVSVATMFAISGGATPDAETLRALMAAPAHQKTAPYLRQRFADWPFFSTP